MRPLPKMSSRLLSILSCLNIAGSGNDESVSTSHGAAQSLLIYRCIVLFEGDYVILLDQSVPSTLPHIYLTAPYLSK